MKPVLIILAILSKLVISDQVIIECYKYSMGSFKLIYDIGIKNSSKPNLIDTLKFEGWIFLVFFISGHILHSFVSMEPPQFEKNIHDV